MLLFFRYYMKSLIEEMVIHWQRIILEITLSFIQHKVSLKNQYNSLFFICRIFIALTLLYHIMHQMLLLTHNNQAILKY